MMRFRLRDVPEMLQTFAGRMHVRQGIAYRCWPLLSPMAALYRRTLVRRTRVVAVVGSYGKSTTTRAVTAALGAPTHAHMLYNSWTWIALSLFRIRPGQRHAVIEVGIAGTGDMQAYAWTVHPDIAVVTSVGTEHHRSLGTLDVTRAEKSQMVRALASSGVAVLNADDPNVAWMRTKTAAKIVTFGFGEACDVRADAFRLDWPNGSRFHLSAFGEQRDVSVSLFGRTMIYPILAAIAVAHVEGLDLDQTLARLRALRPTPGRMDPRPLPNGVTALRDDFKSSVETIHSALDVMADIPDVRRIVLLGSISEPPGSQRTVYKAIGERVAHIASQMVVVGHGWEAYWSGARQGGMARSAAVDAGRTVQEAAQALRDVLQAGDVLLIKGRSPEKLDRVRLILEGRRVGCSIRYCSLRTLECEACGMLERGWEGHRVIM